MKARRMVLTLAACVACGACSFAFAATAAEASTPGLGMASVHDNAVPTTKAPKPKIYSLCLTIGFCSTLEVYTKTHSWIAPEICITEAEACVEPLQGSFAKEGKATTYVFYLRGEEAGSFTVTKVKKAKKEYRGTFYFFGGEDGEAVVTT